MPPAGFEPAMPAGERLQTHALDRSANGIGPPDISATNSISSDHTGNDRDIEAVEVYIEVQTGFDQRVFKIYAVLLLNYGHLLKETPIVGPQAVFQEFRRIPTLCMKSPHQ